jgi:serine/threonine-protein kinase
VRDGRPAEDARTLPPAAAPATGQVQLAVSPWADVEVNGTAQGTTPPLSRLTLPEGTHQVTLRNADFAPHTVQVQVSADRPVTLRYRFGS